MTLPLFGRVSEASYLIPAGVGLWVFRRLSAPLKIVAVLALLTCIVVAIEIIAAYLIHYNNFVTNFFEMVEFVVIVIAYFLYVRNRNSRLILISLSVPVIAVFLIKLPHLYNPSVIAENTSVVSRLALVALSLVALQSVMDSGTERVVDVPFFWVVFGVMLYSAGTIMVFGLADRLLKIGLPYFEMGWRVNWLLNIAANLFYTEAFLCRRQL